MAYKGRRVKKKPLGKNPVFWAAVAILVIVAVLASTPLMKLLRIKLEQLAGQFTAWSKAWNVVFYGIIPVILLLLSTACLVGDSYNPFIYFQF